jgi:hypothetical protein
MTTNFRWARFAAPLVCALLATTAAFAEKDKDEGKDKDKDRQKAILDLGPVAYWPLDENSTDKIVRDRTHHDHDGFYEGATAGAPGSSPGKRAALFGIPGINLVGTNVAATGNAARSIIAWIKTTYQFPQAIVATGTPDLSQAFNLVMTFGGCQSLGLMGFGDDFYPCGAFLADGAWHMVAATYDGAGTLSLYVDGNLDSQALGFSYATTGQTNYIGRSNHVVNDACCHRPFNGSIDDVAIFGRALTAAEIAALASL